MVQKSPASLFPFDQPITISPARRQTFLLFGRTVQFCGVTEFGWRNGAVAEFEPVGYLGVAYIVSPR
jgi:hypothetical protein